MTMRILALTNLYPRPGRETLAPFNRQQFDALARRHDLAIMAPVSWVDEWLDWKAGRPRIERRAEVGDVRICRPRYCYPPGIFRSVYGRFYLASVRREARKLLREFQPDVLLACWAHPDGWAAVRLAREAGIPCAIKVVGSDVLVAGRSGRRRARVVEALRGADAVAAVSEDLADKVVAMGVDAARVHVVPEGLDGRLFFPGDRDEARRRLGLPAGCPIILFVGNLLLSKGAGVLLESLSILRRGGLEPRCYLVGGGRDEAALRATIGRLGLGDRVTMVGPRPLAELPDWYRASNLVALPSFSEGIPNVLRESAACGCPFVATRVGGIPEIARDAASRLVGPDDPAALADAIVEVLGWGPRPATGWISWDESADRMVDVLLRCHSSDDSTILRQSPLSP